MRKALTIVIPTYNRVTDLTRLLESAVREIGRVGPTDVEVLVLDNASDDGTQEVLQRMTAEHDCIRTIRNPENVGMIGNFVRCIESASGRYMWMIGDDEELEEGSIALVLELIRSHPKSAYVFNFNFVGHPQGMPFLRSVCGWQLQTATARMADFVNRFGWFWTLGNLGMVVVDADLVKAIDPAPHMTSCFVQAGLYLEALVDKDMMFVNQAVFRTFSRSQNENKQRWAIDGTRDSFIHICDSLRHMIRKGVLPAELPLSFFNSCCTENSPIWNYIYQPIAEKLAAGQLYIPEREWDVTAELISYLGPADVRESLLNSLKALRNSLALTRLSFENSLAVHEAVRERLSSGRK